MMTIKARRRRRLLPMAAMALVAGCGSTVANLSSVNGNGSNGNGLGAPGSARTTTGPSVLAGPGGTTAPGSLGGATSGAPGTVSTGSAGGGDVTGPAVTGQGVGVTATRIYVGITYTTNGDAANKALGASSITEGDQRADAQAVVDDINAHGGIAGRKLTPVWYNYDVTDTRPYAAQDAAACAKFTQDNHVFAVLGNGESDNYTACTTKAGAIDVGSNIIGPDNAYFRRFSDYIGYDTVSQDRMMADEVNVLQRMHYFTKWDNTNGKPGALPVKVGVIGYDTPSWSTPLRNVMLPALARAGYPVASSDVQLILYPQDNSQVAPAVTQIQGAVLRFRQDNVTHLIVLDANGSMTLQLMQNARGQHYRPRFGVNTATGMEALSTTGAVDTSQFNGAVGLGWSPTLDLPDGKSDPYLSSRTKACITMIEKRTGQQFASTNAASIALDECDALYLLRQAADRAGPILNQNTIRAAIEGLGHSFTPSGVATAFFSPARHDSLETGYDMTWDNGCSCARYLAQHAIA